MITKHINIKLSVCLLIITISLIMPFKVFAVTSDFYSSNDILFYDSKDTGCTSLTSTGSVELVKSNNLQKIFQLLINGGMNATQASAVMGNMYAESSFNSGVTESNGIGYGLVQWSFGRRTSLEEFAKQKNIDVSDMPMQIEFLLKEYNSSYKSLLDSTDFKDATDIAKATEAWMIKYEAPLMKPENDPAALNSKRIPAAIKIYGFYFNLVSGATATVSVDGCNNTGNGAVAGNIIATALNYALKTPAIDGMTAVTDATPAYQAAKAQYNPSINITDCGGFIGTVMIASGVDVNYPNVGTTLQYNYVKSHPEKYLVIDNPTVENLQPGDILISLAAGHTTLYSGNQNYTDIDASFNDRVPSVRNSSSHIWMLEKGSIIARIIK